MSGYLGDQQNYISGAPNDGYQYATVSTAILSPTSRGSIDIASSDMSDPPVINPNWLSHPTDQQVMIAGFKRVRELFKSKAVQPLLNGKEAYPGEQVQTDEQILALIRKSINTVYHAAATCAMGRKDDTMAVVDSKARVYGVKNLRVVDASAFPFLPPGHPQATVCKSCHLTFADPTRQRACMLTPSNVRCASGENRQRYFKRLVLTVRRALISGPLFIYNPHLDCQQINASDCIILL